MSFEHSFSNEFYVNGTEETNTKKPTSVYNAVWNMIRTMSKRKLTTFYKDIFNCDSSTYVDIDTVMEKIRETNTVRTLTSPVEVYIDADGYYSVLVYDETDKAKHNRYFK